MKSQAMSGAPIIIIILSLALIQLLPFAMGSELSYASLNGDMAVRSGIVNFAVASQALLSQKGWSAINVNNRQASIVYPSCKTEGRSLSSMSGDDILLIETLKDAVLANPAANKFTTYFGGNGGSSSSSSGGFSGPEDFKLTTPNLPYGWATVIREGDNVAVVYTDGRVRILPVSCVPSNEMDTIIKLRQESGMMANDQISGTFKQVQDMMSSITGGMFGGGLGSILGPGLGGTGGAFAFAG